MEGSRARPSKVVDFDWARRRGEGGFGRVGWHEPGQGDGTGGVSQPDGDSRRQSASERRAQVTEGSGCPGGWRQRQAVDAYLCSLFVIIFQFLFLYALQ